MEVQTANEVNIKIKIIRKDETGMENLNNLTGGIIYDNNGNFSCDRQNDRSK